nr:hypothetical protein Iba_chr12dCG12450 [Ipomoea batatas]
MKKNQGNREGDTILVKSYKFKENLKLLFEEERKEKRKMMLLELVAADRPSISDGLKRSDRWKKQTVRILGTTRNPESSAMAASSTAQTVIVLTIAAVDVGGAARWASDK